MSARDPRHCPVLRDTRGLSQTARQTIQRLHDQGRTCAGCPQTGQCRVLDRLRESLAEALLDMWAELDPAEDRHG